MRKMGLYVEHKVIHSISYQSPIKLFDKEFLREVIREEIIELERMLGWERRKWLD